MLRDYQQRALSLLYGWFREGNKGNPCLMLPTGSGKSHIIAALCQDALRNWPGTRILMLTHVRELIGQNAAKLRAHWPNAPMGIYSSGMRQRRLGEPITFAGVQSVHSRAGQIGHIDLCLIDECHLVDTKNQGRYRELIDALLAINPSMRVIGLTATPWRLGHGRIDSGDNSLFDDLIEPVTIEELIHKGHLAPLHSKHTDTELSTKGVHKRGGEYIAGELERAVDTVELNRSISEEIIARAGERKAWLLFCSGVEHAQHMADELTEHGITAACITGKTPSGERDRIIERFKSGEIRALTNAQVLTTGFDYPDIDLIAMIRPTMSATLYVQMAGRGMRPKSHTDHCLVLDFAGNVRQHGPITAVQAPDAKAGDGEAPVKACPQCDELVHLSLRHCPGCGYEFERATAKDGPKLYGDDIMGLSDHVMAVGSWSWRSHTSKSSGKDMVKVTYYPEDLSGKPVTEYLPVMHGGLAGQRAVSRLVEIAKESGASLPQGNCSMWELAESMQAGAPPNQIHYRMEGKWPRVEYRQWESNDEVA